LFENLDLSTSGLIYAVATLGSASSTGSGIALTVSFETTSINRGTSFLDYDVILLEPSSRTGQQARSSTQSPVAPALRWCRSQRDAARDASLGLWAMLGRASVSFGSEKQGLVGFWG